MCLVGGAAIGRFVLAPAPTVIEKRVEVPVPAKAPTEAPYLKWKVALSFPVDTPLYGGLARKFADKLRRASAGAIALDLEEPGKLGPPGQCLDAVGQGKLEACWSTPSMWVAKDPAFAVFGGVPFGPEAVEYEAWLHFGGGLELLDETYARFNVKSLLCGLTTPAAGGWFKKPVQTAEDLKGLKIRAFGLAARVLSRAGASPRRVEADRILPELKDGALDGALFSFPAVDLGLGFHSLVSNYYFPGWQQPTVPLELLVNKKTWDALPDTSRAQFELACGDTLRDGLSEGEAMQAAALRELRVKGVVFQRWPQAVLDALEKAWLDVVEAESAADANFKRVWGALAAFRAEYETWRRLGHTP
ncbi:MAG: TRAP transporter substrate-binding protein [Rhodospirillaceae bacterium]|nr:TRAP transporter substrate-binding protein [Rhodospirillaceae bacterium]